MLSYLRFSPCVRSLSTPTKRKKKYLRKSQIHCLFSVIFSNVDVENLRKIKIAFSMRIQSTMSLMEQRENSFHTQNCVNICMVCTIQHTELNIFNNHIQGSIWIRSVMCFRKSKPKSEDHHGKYTLKMKPRIQL